MLPSDWAVKFYYFYSYFILIICWVIAPLQFYVILTQSKSLKSFKWLVLNHSVWCFATQSLFAIVKPIILFPIVAGYPMGVARAGSFQTTAILYFVASIFIVNMAQALGAAILNRYLFAFPSVLTKFFTFKMGSRVMFGTVLINYVGPMIVLWPILKMDRKEMLQIAFEQDPSLFEYFEEPAFLALPYTSVKTAYIASLVAFVITFFIAIFIVAFLSYYVKCHKSMIFSKLQRSLIISAILELAVSMVFLVMPLIAFSIIICFQIPHTENWSIYIFSFILTHSLIQSLTTMYFITPYRKFICQLFSVVYYSTPKTEIVNPNRIYSIY